MKIAKALAPLALLTLAVTPPAYAAKEPKVPRCNGKAKRPANPYGTVLPTLPSRNAQNSGNAAPPTNLFPSSSEAGDAASDIEHVPAISAAFPSPSRKTDDQPVYASC
jgi:hypothetical protein